VGGVLPAFLIPLFAALSAAGSLAGGGAAIARAVQSAKVAKEALEEIHRHNRAMIQVTVGKGLYLKPYKTGLGLNLPKKRVSLPRRALTNIDLLHYVEKMKIPHFRSVFMRDDLPKTGPRRQESATLNLDDSKGPGIHWVAFRKTDHVTYFDSFGNLRPPSELIEYLGADVSIQYNHEAYQDFNL